MTPVRCRSALWATIFALVAGSPATAPAQARPVSPVAPAKAPLSEAKLREILKRHSLVPNSDHGPITEISSMHSMIGDQELPLFNDVPDLKRLNLSRTAVAGIGFKGVKSLQRLEELNLISCPVTDAGLAEIAKLNGLKALWVGEKHLTDKGMEAFRSLKNLQRLELLGLEISDAGFSVLKHLDSLENLRLSNLKRVTNGGIAELSALKRLKWVTIEYGAFDKDVFQELGHFPALAHVSVSYSPLEGVGADQLLPLKTLKSLHMMDVTDAGLKDIGALEQLTSLNTGGKKISPAGLRELTRLKNLRFLTLWLPKFEATVEQRRIDEALAALRSACLETIRALVRVGVGPGDIQQNFLTAFSHFRVALLMCEELSRHPVLFPELKRTQSLDAALKELREALPACKIRDMRY